MANAVGAYRNHVEPHRNLGGSPEEREGCPPQPVPLRLGNGLLGRPVRLAGAGFDLHEHDGRPVAGHDVHLATPPAPVAGHDPHPLGL